MVSCRGSKACTSTSPGSDLRLFIAPRGMIALSTVITEKDIAGAVERADMAMCDVAAEMGNSNVRKG